MNSLTIEVWINCCISTLGSHLYVSAEGLLEVLQDDSQLGTLGPGKAFGELALLYNCKRTASVRGSLLCKLSVQLTNRLLLLVAV